MGRIADAVVSLLAAGPAAAEDLGEALARAGVTRARDPASAVRRAARDDPRIIAIADGRLASVADALAGLDFVTVVTADAAAAGAVEVEPDLAPLGMIGIGPSVALPSGIAAGDAVAVRVEDAVARRVSVRRLPGVAARAADEAAVLAGIVQRLSRSTTVAPPVADLRRSRRRWPRSTPALCARPAGRSRRCSPRPATRCTWAGSGRAAPGGGA